LAKTAIVKTFVNKAVDLNLKLRLNLIITGLLLLVMLAGIALSFNNARRNTLAEIASAERSALYLFDSAITGAMPKNVAKIDLSTFKLQQLSHMRHLKIELIDSNGKLLDSNHAASGEQLSNEAPAWFEHLLNKTMPQWQPKIKTLSVNNQLLAKLVITPDPTYEYAEIWKQMTDLLVLQAIFFICVNLMIAWAIAQALKPTESILHTLNALEKGDLTARLPHFQLPEIARIGQKFNHMIETLQQSIFQNHKLTQQLITLQEAERKSLARDLHDEFGQCLTAINTDASVILKSAKTKYPELQASAQAITELSRHLMDLVSGLLQRLRPGVLNELGLQVALQDLVDNWRNRHENISCSLSISNANDIANLNDTESLVIYRLAQESLTNIARHANATSAEIKVYAELKNGQYGIGIKVQDNGVGFEPSQTDGLGLAGMRERVESLNGDFSLQTQINKGSTIMAWLPLKQSHLIS
jgi:two-component system, NarL family, sensor histidine kinase UhpB